MHGTESGPKKGRGIVGLSRQFGPCNCHSPKGDFYHMPPFFPPWSHVRMDGQSGAYRKSAHVGWVG